MVGHDAIASWAMTASALPEDVLAWLGPIAMGIGLAALSGLRAFIPPLALALAGRTGLVPLAPEFEWLAGMPAIIALSTAVILEVLADKVPVVDNALDSIGMFVRPAAGALVAAVPLFSVAQALEQGEAGTLSWIAGAVGIAVGGTLGGVVQLIKAHVRLGTTPLSMGLANPLVSLAEDLATVLGVILSILLPLMTLALLVSLLVIVMRRRRRRRSRGIPPTRGADARIG